MRGSVLCLMLLLVSGAVAKGQTSPYTTNFPATENPISQGGVWLNGATNGLDWGDVQTDGTHAFGVSLPTVYGDPTAALTGTWSADQTAQAVVKMGAQPSSCCSEVELRLRTSIAPHLIKGYEILFSITTNTYVQIVRWNGPLANSSNSNNGFTYLNSTTGPGLRNGDVLRATIVGNTITAYQNSAQILQATDTGQGGVGPWTSGGSPGVGFYDNADTNWSPFGFSSFTATDNADAGVDAGLGGNDAGADASLDAGSAGADSGTDASAGSIDAGVDAGSGSTDAAVDAGANIIDAGGAIADGGPDGGGANGDASLNADSGGTDAGTDTLAGSCGCSVVDGPAMLLATLSLRLTWRRRKRHPFTFRRAA